MEPLAFRATISHPDGRVREVKNLGWLLRRWKEVDHLTIKTRRETWYAHGAVGWHPEAELTAKMRGGVVYRTTFASLAVLIDWLHRPSFYSCTVTIDGIRGVIAAPWSHSNPFGGATYTNDSGSGRWITRAIAGEYVTPRNV